ncbi:MAG: DUF262 domain-containing protein [Clostridium sp.]|nr:DUF262 domain-containing protein [Clostridium sp.]
MNSEIILDTKLIGRIEGRFFIPSYQRGYRWGQEEVKRLLDDIYANGSKNYCLQPLVVKRLSEKDVSEKELEVDEWFEVIDGQQRLTTLYLIYAYLYKESGGFFFKEPAFLLVYETRKKSADFLKSLDMTMKCENIDFWFICNAYETIKSWFDSKEDKQNAMINIYKYLSENVKVIWYEVDKNEDAIALFTRLNIGKIKLTNAELVKALFLSQGSASNMTTEKQEEIALQWDNIERELQNDTLWYFLSNYTKKEYQTRIDLILDLIAQKDSENREEYYTFFHFDGLRKKESLDNIWRTIQRTFLNLKDWFENHELYHKIGYLIASECVSLQEIYKTSLDKTKNQFITELDNAIKKSINISNNYADLSYEKDADRKDLYRLLLLFNIESVRQNGEQTQWFPFDKFKLQESGKITWSLEHIHAQQSEGLRTEASWREWLRLHLSSIKSLYGEEALTAEIQTLLDRPKFERMEFETVQSKVVRRLSVEGNTEYLHSIANLALLNMSDNAALSNSTFDVKRNVIIEMDKKGQYIPFCTKMVFLKYYTPSKDNQLHFWGQTDRIAYVKAMNTVLQSYLEEPIQHEMEDV